MRVSSWLLCVMLTAAPAAFAAEPADSAATTSADAGGSSTGTADSNTGADENSADAASADDGTDADADADDTAPRSLDGEGFVPSVQISEDLSVSFPTDI